MRVRRAELGKDENSAWGSSAALCLLQRSASQPRPFNADPSLAGDMTIQGVASSIQDWGEEVEEGAVYHVTLKRVQIQQAANKGARWLG
ncbi:hypothetical protein STEG23_019186, partial [Scotinomys teguina]